jgi:hypothetical protein
MRQALWTPHAIAELEDILFYISVEAGRPLAGEQNYEKIRRLARSLPAMTLRDMSTQMPPRVGITSGINAG